MESYGETKSHSKCLTHVDVTLVEFMSNFSTHTVTNLCGSFLVQDSIAYNNTRSASSRDTYLQFLKSQGGCPVFIETAAIPIAPSEGGGSVNIITGQLGSVMKESVNIAYTYARQFVAIKAPQNTFFKGPSTIFCIFLLLGNAIFSHEKDS